MGFEFKDRPKQEPNAGAQATRQETAAETVARRKRAWVEAEEIARQRRERIAAVRSGKLPQSALDASELIILKHLKRIESGNEHRSFVSNLVRRLFGTGMGMAVSAFVTTVTSFGRSCVPNPFLYKIGGVLGGLTLFVLALAVALWFYEHWFL